MPTKTEDPVCHMFVQSNSMPIEYEGVCYAFCSEQCKDRFETNPRLYVGYPGSISPGQTGEKIVKFRRLKLDNRLDEKHAEIIKNTLQEMMGVEVICIEGDQIEIQYDLLQATAEQISDKLALTGDNLGGGWVAQLKFSLISNMEEIEIRSIEVENKIRL